MLFSVSPSASIHPSTIAPHRTARFSLRCSPKKGHIAERRNHFRAPLTGDKRERMRERKKNVSQHRHSRSTNSPFMLFVGTNSKYIFTKKKREKKYEITPPQNSHTPSPLLQHCFGFSPWLFGARCVRVAGAVYETRACSSDCVLQSTDRNNCGQRNASLIIYPLHTHKPWPKSQRHTFIAARHFQHIFCFCSLSTTNLSVYFSSCV